MQNRVTRLKAAQPKSYVMGLVIKVEEERAGRGARASGAYRISGEHDGRPVLVRPFRKAAERAARAAPARQYLAIVYGKK